MRFLLILASLTFVLFANATPKTFKVTITGKGTPMVLIPGYACSGEVWKETVDNFSGHYECHVLTLAGFAGEPPVAEPSLTKVRDEIIEYVKEKHLEKSILIGHSLGGEIALWLASTAPSLFSKTIIVDALPFYSLLYGPTATVESSRPYAEMARTTTLNTTQTEASASGLLQMMITSPDKISAAAKWSLASDKTTMAQYIYELMTTDLRTELSKIQSPILVLGSWTASQAYGGTKESQEKSYKEYYKNAPQCTVQFAETAKHFIMFDDPKWFFAEIEKFLQK